MLYFSINTSSGRTGGSDDNLEFFYGRVVGSNLGEVESDYVADTRSSTSRSEGTAEPLSQYKVSQAPQMEGEELKHNRKRKNYCVDLPPV